MKKVLFVAVLFGAAHISSAQTPVATSPHQISPLAIHQLDSFFHYLDTSGLYNGNILVGVGGKKAAGASIGYSNLQTKDQRPR